LCFREDLFYLINVVAVRVPPLRERPEDFGWQLERFLDEFSETFDANVSGVSALAEKAAALHPWPGNVRELKNRVERAVALGLGPWLMPGDLFPEAAPVGLPAGELPSLETARLAAERQHILRALTLTGGEMIPADKALGISRTTLWEKMRRLRSAGDVRSHAPRNPLRISWAGN
jgi:DNA-binding NtrC family response regulator